MINGASFWWDSGWKQGRMKCDRFNEREEGVPTELAKNVGNWVPHPFVKA
jgi:hypothetical protein